MEGSKLEKEQDKNEEQGKQPGLVQAILRYSDSKDMLLMSLGMVGCFADGSSAPLIMLVLSHIMNKYAVESSFTLHDINQDSIALVYVAIGVGMGAFLGEYWFTFF
ncbi:hypothetical protein Acr_29g0003610 [Actinidia rufa]|uniref:Uncharacterized protein n=1 Tax=Actinidia rufa TaxID=165716 RepID=A0A7J0HDP8_9ERIC|nr:hypothetical protein Acr_29g0003610 [Actinidia rufa]